MRLMPRGRWARVRFAGICVVLPVLLTVGGCWMIAMPGSSHAGPLPEMTAEEGEAAGRMETHVRALAEIGPRQALHPEGLEAAADYVEGAFGRLGYDVDVQEYRIGDLPCRNFAVELPGSTDPDRILIVGAHYDSAPACPAANDNATGTAAVLEIARIFHGRQFPITVRFVAFTSEEPPIFMTEQMGSRVYARRCKQRGEDIVGMIALETLGCYFDEPGSQRYPFPLSLFYPGTGNFVGFVGNVKSRSLVRRSVASFRGHTQFPSEGAALPGWIAGVGWSDHWSFWREGYPALMVTDTAPYRYPHYHRATDTPDKVDFDRLARVTLGVSRVVADLAGPPAR